MILENAIIESSFLCKISNINQRSYTLSKTGIDFQSKNHEEELYWYSYHFSFSCILAFPNNHVITTQLFFPHLFFLLLIATHTPPCSFIHPLFLLSVIQCPSLFIYSLPFPYLKHFQWKYSTIGPLLASSFCWLSQKPVVFLESYCASTQVVITLSNGRSCPWP